LPPAYSGQIVVRNGIAAYNGNAGVVNSGSGNSSARIYIHNNTLVHNGTDTKSASNPCADLTLSFAPYIDAYANLVVTSPSPGCPHSVYASRIDNSTATTRLYSNWLYSAAGQNTYTSSNNGFTGGPNEITGKSPQLRNPVMPPAPDCSGKSSVIACMSGMITNFASLNASATGYGYQRPRTTTPQTSDPLFPQWLCTANLPAGLITMHCTSQ
jgi:hypothetical protein